jgi:hypothetical protein
MTTKYFSYRCLRKIFISLFFLYGTYVFGQVGIQTNSPDPSSALDIDATDKGLLIPRVTLTSTLSNPSPITSPATGLLVFNTGANQPVGLYYWTGSSWSIFNAGTISADYWSLTGNAGTTVGTNFIGTTDAEDFALYTDDTERMRFTSGGQGLVGLTTPNAASDFFTINANSTQNYALNIISPAIGVYIDAVTFGFISFVDYSDGYSFYAKNFAAPSYGGFVVGSNRGAYTLNSHFTGLSSHGDDGIFTLGQASDGIGIIAGGNNVGTLSTIPDGAGGAFTGYHGVYGKAVNSSTGVGIIGVGNNGGTYNTTTNGSGGAFTGYHGLIATSTNTTYGTGAIGVGNAGSYYTYNDGSGHYGSGGAFTGDYCGVAGWANTDNNSSVGVYGYYNGSGSYRDGTGVKGIAVANSGRGYGVYGQGNRYGVYANGNLGASGTKSFAIDHPMDPENKILKHYSIESNEVLNMYRGVIVLDDEGNATVTLPDYFTTININYSYTLTPIGMKAPDLFIKAEIDDNGQFKIGGGNPNQKISWVVYADRNDPYMQKHRNDQVDVIEKDADQKGKYITPELYDQPASKGIFYSQPTLHEAKSVKRNTIENKTTSVSEKKFKK